ncbi:MAG: D-alanyl-D-alanine carboxypeptidase [Clostridia bacterium]|nr:D-alanyl-D-alanine carboxypeptidase [Clostridia bacterium]
MRKISILILCIITVLVPTLTLSSSAEENVSASQLTLDKDGLNLEVKSAYLLEAKTGTVLYSQNPLEASSVASVTKIMTLLLVAEALSDGIINLEQEVYISDYAASMGGSQVFLEEGEKMSVEELIKCTVIASANDAAVALAEQVSGSESAFVKKMNARAEELGLKNTAFENTTGLDDTTVNHYSCAEDVAIMSRELIKHDIILKYSSMWQDTIRNGEFTLTNTNRLVRYYEGCNGLKTGSTDKAGYCVSTTAKRGGMQLVAVIIGAPTRDERNAAARELLDYGFANFSLKEFPSEFIENVPVWGGTSDLAPIYSGGFEIVINKENATKIEAEYEIPDHLTAPVSDGETVGKIIFTLNGQKIGECDIYCGSDVAKIGFFELFYRMLMRIVSGV